MEYYRNSSGISGIKGFEYTENGILIEFKNGGIYEYTNYSAGIKTISEMKKLAKNGRNLNSYINRNAKHAYSRKIK